MFAFLECVSPTPRKEEEEEGLINVTVSANFAATVSRGGTGKILFF